MLQPELECENLYCRASGTVGLQNMTYPYPVTSNADFHLVVTLTSRQGDVDLLVTPPGREQERWSRMRAGDSRQDSVVIQRGDLQRSPGTYLITVVSAAQVVSDFSLAVQRATAGGSPDLAAEDREVLQEVMDQCCAADGTCPQLRAAAANSRFARFCDAVPNQCDGQGRLTHLSLASEGLACPFPRALNRLAALTRLDLTFNKLDGSLERDVAPVVEVLPDLEHLNLGYNALTGTLSCRLLLADRQLAELDLADNQKGGGLSGELPSFANAAALRVLRLGGNALTGPLPDLPVNVQEVRLQHNRLEGGIPDSYSDLVNLHTLKLEHNRLSGPLMAGVAALPMLEVFDVSENRLTGLLPASWTTAKLVELDAHDNALTGPLPASLAQLPRLAYLQLQDNQLTGTLDAYVDALSAAESPSATRFVSLGGNRLSGGVPDGLQNLAAFQPGAWNILDGWMFEKTLNVSGNDLSGPLPVWALQRFTADEGLTVKLAGNKWTCPEGRIGVAASVDEVKQHQQSASDVETRTSGSEQPGQLKLPFQDLSEQQIWDAAWDDEDVDSAPATPSKTDPFLHLPEETELERLENAHKAHSPPVLPDWAPGHHVNTPSRDADVDRHISTEDTWTDQDRGANRGFDHVLTLPEYPINDVWEEHSEGDYSYTDESPAGESSVPGVAEAREGDTGGDEPHRKATPQDAVDSIHTAALSGSSGEGINTAQAQAFAVGSLHADIKAYRPPVLEEAAESDNSAKTPLQ
ncbi:hypothetical protein COCSUDRAFT_83604 [Coccomyxa subellipsoidea C-169]|uniref:L domain-like protein n=1 Tax=Coccomyxa subellipsoidea (strain C-169) TaxID=574566 RepID=I0YJP6_COCSC|nr:hypothetical protein COCSUDRAFT_83604 [Coccomyxa subellipsoidea C-169]EIE18615.1 hypothetical protein COCSUDRAFT_83604 [Coccomyxa subellipsoidea C-169]|eukprot:XP_005643159.1 hypothetical protein COCSUDRAFT_83604 [Coccomyxa subellipsoidea C-169]